MNKKDNTKNFVIINSYYLGDMLLVNSMIQNIKRIYKDSRVIMLSSESLYELSKYQEGVDDVIIWDRAGKHKNFSGMLKFIKEFPYKDIFATFPIYGTDRPVILSFLLGSKYILFRNKKNILKILLKRKYKFDKMEGDNFKIQAEHVNLLKGITKEELIDYKIKYNVCENTKSPIENIKDYVVLCPISSRVHKDMYKEVACELIQKFDKKVVLLGHGKASKEMSDYLATKSLDNLVDLTNNTTIQEAAKVMQDSNGVISVDTGLMHLAYALDKPTVGIFYHGKISPFMPDKNLYKNTTAIVEDFSADNIIATFNNLLVNQ